MKSHIKTPASQWEGASDDQTLRHFAAIALFFAVRRLILTREEAKTNFPPLGRGLRCASACPSSPEWSLAAHATLRAVAFCSLLLRPSRCAFSARRIDRGHFRLSHKR